MVVLIIIVIASNGGPRGIFRPTARLDKHCIPYIVGWRPRIRGSEDQQLGRGTQFPLQSIESSDIRGMEGSIAVLVVSPVELLQT